MDCIKSLPNEELLKLKCDICTLYLSHFPIGLTQEKNICGRCLHTINQENYKRNEVYETVAKFMKFPCKFYNEGCLESFLPEDIPQHEENCTFQLVQCPVSKPACNWTGAKPFLINHCQDKHSDLMLQSCKFSVDLTKTYESENLVDYNSSLFLIKQKFYSINKLLMLAICKTKWDVNSADTCRVNFVTKSRKLMVKCKISSCPDDFAEIFMNALKESQDVSITARIMFEDSPKAVIDEALNLELLSKLKCAQCSTYILPPIYYRENASNVCGTCSLNKPSQVPMMRNNALEAVANLLNYPCKNEGCSFIAKPPNMKYHRQFCVFGTHCCPLAHVGCSWTGLGKNINDHIVHLHVDLILTEKEVTGNVACFSTGLTNKDQGMFAARCITKSYIIKFASSLFCLLWSSYNSFYTWDVQLIGPFTSGFSYEISILDKEKVKSLKWKQPCRPMQITNNPEGKVCFHEDQVKNFIVAGNLSFIVEMFKV